VEAAKYNFDIPEGIQIEHLDILDTPAIPKDHSETVICSEVLEHLKEWRTAFDNLLKLAESRLIVTVPWQFSFMDAAPPPKGHCNFWSSHATQQFRPIQEFAALARPFACSIQRIRTKPRDISMKQYNYLIIVDKKQKWNSPHTEQ
jgi:hypothetical protein